MGSPRGIISYNMNDVVNKHRKKPKDIITVSKKEVFIVLPYLGIQSKLSLNSLNHACIYKFYGCFMYQSNRSFNIPPGQSPGHLNFWKIFGKFPPSRGRKAVQMPHYSSFPGGEMPPTLGKHFSSFYYAPEAVYVNMV